MAARTTIKCFKCKKDIPKAEAIKKTNKYYCECCNKEAEDYKELIDYICNDLYKIKAPTGLMIKQIKDFKEKYNFSNSGIMFTLKYYYEILENKILEDAGLGIVPYYYEKAKNHYTYKFILEEYIEGFTEEVVVEKHNMCIRPSKYKKSEIVKEIDWSEDLEEE